MSFLEELYAGTGIGGSHGTVKPILDIVAIHGLNPKGSKTHAIDTWQNEKSGNLWLRDQIPLKQPKARVLLYSYDSSPVFGESHDRFTHEADQFLERLVLKRKEDSKRPLLLMGHSLGGILIKQALVNALTNPRYHDIQTATYGLIFFGTPHGGSGSGWQIMVGKSVVRIAQSLRGRDQDDIMEALKQGSLFSDSLQNQWRHQLDHYKIVTFYEGKGEIVPRQSAVLGLPGDHENQVRIQATHGNMCQFDPSVVSDRANYELVEGNVVELCTMATQLGNIVKEKQHESLLRTFEPYSRNPRRSNLPQAHRESFQWIWDNCNPKPGFVNWLRGKSPLFWISGKPGAGKSTLMGYLVESEETLKLISENSTEVVLVHYFFHDLGESQEKSFGGLLHAIVHQLLIGFHLKDRATLSRLYKLLKPHLSWDLTLREPLPNHVLVRILHKLVAQCQETLKVYLFIDGLDECHGDHREQLDILIDLVRRSSDKTLSVRACIASRVETEIQLRLSNEPTIAIDQFTKNDISAYVTSELRKEWDLMARQHDGTTAFYDRNLVDNVVANADGVFVWVKAVVSQLVVGIEHEDCDLYSLLADLPKDLEDLYSSILHKIDQKRWPDTINFLRLVQEQYGVGVHGDRFFVRNLDEMSGAILDPMSAITCSAAWEVDFTFDAASLPHNQRAQVKRRLQRSCRGLIEIGDTEEDPNARVTLLHRTVEEYLSKSLTFKEMVEKVDKNSLKDPAVALMAMSLRLLKCYPRDLHNWSDYHRNWRFRGFFAAVRSVEWVTGIPQTAYVEELDRVFCLIDSDWTTMYYNEEPIEKEPSLETDILSLVVFYGLAIYLQHQIVTKGKGIIQTARGRPLLFYAVDGLVREIHHGRHKSVLITLEVLLNNGADPMETFNGRTPWSHWVDHVTNWDGVVRLAQSDLSKISELMLEHGADPTNRHKTSASNTYRFQPYWSKVLKRKDYSTTFHYLLEYLRGRPDANEAIIKLLVDHCNDFEATDSDGIGIQEWADSINPEMGDFLRQEIAAKNQRKRRRIH